MDVSKKSQKFFAGLLNQFREQPAARRSLLDTPPVAAIPEQMGFGVRTLTARDFTPGSWRADEWSPVAYYRIPEGTIVKLQQGRIFRMMLRQKGGGSVPSGEVPQASFPINVPGIVNSRTAKPSLPATYHPDVVIYQSGDGQNWTAAQIVEIDYENEQAMFNISETEVESYYLSGLGEWRLRSYTDAGNSRVSGQTIVNGSFGALHFTDQSSRDTAFVFPANISLVPGQRLSLEVKTPREVVFNARAQHVISFDTLTQKVSVADSPRLKAASELDLGR